MKLNKALKKCQHSSLQKRRKHRRVASRFRIEPSRRQAREDINNGAISMNGEKVTDVGTDVTVENSFDGRFIIIRKGRRTTVL